MATFVGSDGSILDKLTPDLTMDLDVICSMDEDLASLARLPRNATGGAASQATTTPSTQSTTPTISTAKTAAAGECSASSKRNPNSSSNSNSNNNSSSSSINGSAGASGRQHGVQQHSLLEEERSERACTAESLLDDGDTPDDFLENLRELEWEAGAGAALDATGGHDGNVDTDDEQRRREGRSRRGGIEASGVKKRKKDLGKGVGEDASGADKQRARYDTW